MKATFTQIETLGAIKAGDRFEHDGIEHEAMGDAVTYVRNGFLNVQISAKRRHAQMPSGWELATVLVHAELVEIADRAERDEGDLLVHGIPNSASWIARRNGYGFELNLTDLVRYLTKRERDALREILVGRRVRVDAVKAEG